jgi:hypothetical protein
VIVYAGESRSQKEKEVIVAEIFPDKELLESDGVTDIAAYFDREVKRINRLNPSYKTVNLVKIRTEEFSKKHPRRSRDSILIRASIRRRAGSERIAKEIGKYFENIQAARRTLQNNPGRTLEKALIP